MTPEENARFQRECDGCPAMDDQLDRVRRIEAMLVAERKAHAETKEKRLEFGRAFSDRTEDWERAVRLAERATEKMEAAEEKLKTVKAIDGGLQGGIIGGIDLADGPDHTATQSWLSFSCPVGCEHRVLLPDYPSPEATCVAIKDQTGLKAWETVGGAVCWDRHEVSGCSSEIVGEPVRTIAKYSEDITDSLATARLELDCAILGVDSEKAWALTKNKERDLWISSVEMFMAAILKWAQGQDANSAEKKPADPGLHRAHQTEGD